ncbi:DMT family transporter [Paenibacillus sp. OV219]|uniref:DMT family transporter n=1 Tax=Paenibacillus sp. OV219 TaxID=1884377 RepID=UPI0008D403E2|nr:DMT family transporter [Paenibacillus sp. OV219]SEO33243.1 Uncharacterized membrane protein [Paenibacillus sp. OV219]
MIWIAISLVLCSGFAHAVWNLFTKRSLDKAAFLWAILVPSELILVPLLVHRLWVTPLPLLAYGLILLSMIIQGVYGKLLSLAYQVGDLSQLYPLMRGTATLLVPLIGIAFLGESLSGWGWLGLGSMIVSFVLLSGWSFKNRLLSDSRKPLLLAFGVGLCTTAYVFIDKLILDYISPMELLSVGNLGCLLALTPHVLRTKQLKQEVVRNGKIITLGAILSPGSYLLFLYALNVAPMAHISPIREIGTVFATFLGVVVLRENQGTKRIVASITIASAILLIAILG